MSKSAANSKADTAVKLVLVFFISLLSFSVGTYVGKQVSDSDARAEARKLEYGGEGHDSHAANDSTSTVSDEEVASLSKEFVDKERKPASEDEPTHEDKADADGHGGHGEAKHDDHAATNHDDHGETKHDDHAEAKHDSHGDAKDTHAAADTKEGYTHHSKIKAEAHETAKADMDHGNVAAAQKIHGEGDHKATAASSAAERVAHDQAPAKDMKPARNPSTVLPTVATTAIGKYTVQVASYATETEAESQATKLTEKGYSAFYVPAEINGKTWYRVSIGLFSDQKSATNYRTELLATQAVASAIVQKIVK